MASEFFPRFWSWRICPYVYADHDTSLRTDLNFSYTFDETSGRYPIFFSKPIMICRISIISNGAQAFSIKRLCPGFLFYYIISRVTLDPKRTTGLSNAKPSLNINTSAIFHHSKYPIKSVMNTDLHRTGTIIESKYAGDIPSGHFSAALYGMGTVLRKP